MCYTFCYRNVAMEGNRCMVLGRNHTLKNENELNHLFPLKQGPAYYVCNVCGVPYENDGFVDNCYCPRCFSERNRMVGTE